MIRLLPLLLVLGCSEPEKTARQKLEFILAEDLRFITEEIRQNDSAAILDKPYYRIIEYGVFPNSRIYNRKAVVEFYYFKTIKMIQVRKYRYNPAMMQWQRYDKKLEFHLSSNRQRALCFVSYC
ncbi:MAG: hypothetical protein A2293_10995 [Elusimicrobia bacterium RIFOXYB2_FULL_49_7]|nr:MAG: hypothetical protein A2293_10995 [Elusimicrobia bacterium RIFOXYB2_FULL_49_7]